MTTLPKLLAHLGAGPAATAPRLTHYDGPERIELSGRVLTNWVAKAANLLLEEADAEPGLKVRLDLPPAHWRAAYWALATWSVGGIVCLRGSGQRADVVVTDSPESLGRDPGPVVVAVTLAALARTFDGPLAAAALDEAAILATYGDHLDVPQEPQPDDVAVLAGGRSRTFADLVPAPGDRPERVLLLAPRDQDGAGDAAGRLVRRRFRRRRARPARLPRVLAGRRGRRHRTPRGHRADHPDRRRRQLRLSRTPVARRARNGARSTQNGGSSI